MVWKARSVLGDLGEKKFQGNLLTKDLMLLIFLALLFALTRGIQIATFGVLKRKFIKLLQMRCEDSILRQDTKYLKSNSPSHFQTILFEYTESFGAAISSHLGMFIATGSRIATGFTILWWVSPHLNILLSSLVTLLILFVTWRIFHWSPMLAKVYLHSRSEVVARTSEVNKEIETVKLFNERPREFNEISDMLGTVYQKARRMELWEGFGDFVEYSVWGAISVTGLWFGALLMKKGLLTFSDFASYSLVSEEFITAIYDLVRIAKDIGGAKNPAIQVFEQLNREPEMDLDGQESLLGNPPPIPELKLDNYVFKFENVSLYSEKNGKKKNILNNLTFELNPQHKVVIVGESGCGKSVLLSVIKRQMRPTSGTVTLGGKNLFDPKEVPLERLYEILGVVSQHSTIFQRTLKRNLNYGTAEKDEIEMSKFPNHIKDILLGVYYRDEELIGPFVSGV